MPDATTVTVILGFACSNRLMTGSMRLAVSVPRVIAVLVVADGGGLLAGGGTLTLLGCDALTVLVATQSTPGS